MSTTCQNYIDLVRELGVPDLESATAMALINLSRQEVVADRQWTFRIATTAAATTPTTLSRMGTVLSVVDSTGTKVQPTAKRDLERFSYDLTSTAAVPDWYYFDSHQVVSTYPLASVTIRYLRIPAAFTTTTDVEDLIPDDFIMAVVYRTAMHANLRMGVADIAAQYGQLGKEALESMAGAYMTPLDDKGPINFPSGP